METPISGGHSHGLRSSRNPVKCSNFSSISQLLFKWNMIDEFYQKMKKLSWYFIYRVYNGRHTIVFFFSFFFELLFMQGISRKADVTLCNECMFLRGSWKRRRRYGEINAKCQRWPTSASSRTSNGFVTGNLCGRYAIAQSIQTRESHQYTRFYIGCSSIIKFQKVSRLPIVVGTVLLLCWFTMISQSLFFSRLDFIPQLWFDVSFDDFRDWSKSSVVIIWDFKEKNIWLNSYIGYIWSRWKVWTECYIKDAKIVGEEHDVFIRKWKSV